MVVVERLVSVDCPEMRDRRKLKATKQVARDIATIFEGLRSSRSRERELDVVVLQVLSICVHMSSMSLNS